MTQRIVFRGYPNSAQLLAVIARYPLQAACVGLQLGESDVDPNKKDYRLVYQQNNTKTKDVLRLFLRFEGR